MTTRSQVSQFERAQARIKTYTTQAVVVLVLYCLLFIPGLIANELWLREAIRTEKVAGKRLPGVGALQLMNQVARLFVVLVIVSAGIWIVLQLTLG